MTSHFLLIPMLWVFTAPPAWANPGGIPLYENGEYEAATQAFEEALATPGLPPEERGQLRIYLAASRHALGQLEQARHQLELLAREHPDQRVDPVRFLPELVELAEAIRQRMEAEQHDAEEMAEQEHEARARAARPPSPPLEDREPAMLPGPPSPTARLRPEVLGLFSAPGRGRCPGVGLTYVRGRLEGGARVWFGNPDAIVHLQGGLLLGSGALQPYLGLRAALAPGAAGYGGGAVVGGRLTLPAGFLALVELGADSFFVGDDFHHRFELTAQAGLGFQLPVP